MVKESVSKKEKNDPAKVRRYRCPLCGFRFTSEEMDACQACPMLHRCHLVMCPNCSHEFPPIEE
jgi:hypothetical protein